MISLKDNRIKVVIQMPQTVPKPSEQNANRTFREKYFFFFLHRIGPKEKYFHCQKCNLCLAQDLRGNHKCVENVSRQNCPVCMEDIHTSRIGAHVLPCGHLLHKTCFDDMVRTGAYRCPLCMHSAWNMEEHWEIIDNDIAQSPMPTEYQGATVK
ncbi:RING finger and CHY zinc finger domain-containing protein 1, partial [Xenoophorus captivus]